jgi:hypothetical protein
LRIFGTQTKPIVATDVDAYDEITIPYIAIKQGQSGSVICNQVYVFNCKVCGGVHMLVPQSGFTHTQTTVAPENGANKLTTSDVPANISVNGQYPGPGKGATPSDTTTPHPP